MKNYLKKIKFVFALLLLVLLSCSKDDTSNTQDTPSTPVLKDNVVIIDASKLQLDESPANIENGIYKFAFTGTAPNISVGSVIVGEQGNGFLRKVTSVAVNGNDIVLQTTQGSMSDVFKDGGFNFYLEMNDMQNRKSNENGFTYTINNQSIYQQGALSIILDNGQVDFNSNWFFDFSFDKNGLSFFEVSSKNGTLNSNFTATVTASQAVTLLDKSTSILRGGKPYTKTYTKYVSVVLLGLPVVIPIKVKMELDLVLDYSASINAAITRQAIFSSNNTFNLGLNYSNGKRNDINSFSPSNSFTLSKSTGNANATINLALTPKVSFKLYNIIGPSLHIGLNEKLSGSVASPALDWDFKADVWLKSTVGINDISILGNNIQGYSKTWETSKLSYKTPYKIEKIAGDNQTGNFSQQLNSPIKVRVLDNLYKVQSNVPVYFTVVDGGGTVQTASILTDANGFAETQWTLGASGKQIVNVLAKKADGSALLDAPLSFSATVNDSPCYDATEPYPTVTVGSQVWMQKNLNVCKYRNGDPIPQVTDPTQWRNLTTGAWCYYENTTANGTVYGKLYNWYAVNDPRGLAPVGFHVPSETEWATLVDFLGGFNIAGGKMKATGTTLWKSPNVNATNTSGFTGLPGGYRSADGNGFSHVGEKGYWWSRFKLNALNVYRQMLDYDNDDTNSSEYIMYSPQGSGYSVRCVKD